MHGDGRASSFDVNEVDIAAGCYWPKADIDEIKREPSVHLAAVRWRLYASCA